MTKRFFFRISKMNWKMDTPHPPISIHHDLRKSIQPSKAKPSKDHYSISGIGENGGRRVLGRKRAK
jgi:hypothetical protein